MSRAIASLSNLHDLSGRKDCFFKITLSGQLISLIKYFFGEGIYLAVRGNWQTRIVLVNPVDETLLLEEEMRRVLERRAVGRSLSLDDRRHRKDKQFATE